VDPPRAQCCHLNPQIGFSSACWPRWSGSHSPICCALNSDFPANWELVLDFLGRHTSPGSRRAGEKIEDCVARFDVGPSLPGGVWSQRSFPEQPGATSPSYQVINMKKEITDLRDRISSNSVSNDSFIFPSLGKTVAWCIQHLPGDVDQALVFLDAPSLINGIGREFSSNQDTRELSEQESWNLTLCLDSAFWFQHCASQDPRKKHHHRRRGQRPSSALRQALQRLVLQ
jgi:hypothetical protein